MHELVQQRESGETDPAHRDPRRLVAGRVDLGLEAGQVEHEERQGRGLPSQTKLYGLCRGDRLGAQAGIGLREGLGQVLGRQDQRAELAQLGAGGQGQVAHQAGELARASGGHCARRADPHSDGHVGAPDAGGQLAEPFVVDGCSGAVDLQHQAERAVGEGLVDGPLDEVGHDRIEIARHFHHVEHARPRIRGEAPGAGGCGRGRQAKRQRGPKHQRNAARDPPSEPHRTVQ